MTQSKNSPWYFLVPPFILSLLTMLVYYPSLHYDFQFDDVANITKHFHLRHYNLADRFLQGTRWISYWLNSLHYQIGRFDPFSYRVGNLIIHITNGILIFFILLMALSGLKRESFFKKQALPLALMTSILFLLHPVQSQTVSYVIQGELEGLAALSILSMALCLINLAKTQMFVKKVILTGLCWAIALLSCGTKEIAIISPALLLLIDWFFIAQGEWQSLKKRWWIHLSIGLIIVTTYIILLKPAFFTEILGLKKIARNNIGNIITHDPTSVITPWMFFRSQFKVILHYLWIFLWPFGISVEYDWMLSRSILAPDSLVPLMLLIAIGFGVYKLLYNNHAHIVGFGALWFFTCIAPRSSIIPSSELLVDYKTYTASFGWLFLLACLLVNLFDLLAKEYKKLSFIKNQQQAILALSCVLSLPLGLATVKRNRVWSSGLEFWGNILKMAPGKARAYNNYGVELSQQLHKFKEAIPYFKKAIAMDKNYPDPCNNLAVAYSHLGKTDNAIEALKKGLRINPYYPEGYNNLASFFLQKKDYDQAEKTLLTALKLRPYYGKAYFNLGRTYLEKGDTQKAWQCFKNACYKADLDNDVGFATYAKVSANLKKYDAAIEGYKRVLQLNPTYPEAKFNLANAYFLAKRHKEAAHIYEQLVKTNPNEHKIVYNLGESYFMLDQPEKALACFNKIQQYKDKMPHMYIRMAGCYNKLGNNTQAQKELQTLADSQTAPADLKNAAKTLLTQLMAQNKKIGRHAVT